ncbi:MAG: MmgE/PrpD family protein [Rhodobacter sp.]|nr:MmgE/PrpD family protein [Rhodobacter sp.]
MLGINVSEPLLVALAVRLAQQPSRAERERAALHVADWIDCAVAGAVTPAGEAFRSARLAAPGPIHTLGSAPLAPPAAAFMMGSLGNPLEMDDIEREAILHPGPVIVPAALVAAQMFGATGAQLLDAVTVGYEATIRLGRSVGSRHYANWHNTATCGPIGAAVAVARLLGLGERRTVWAMGNALTQSSGLWAMRHEDVMTKQLHTARAAEAGLTAACLAADGVSGPAQILEGPQGFYAALCPNPRPEAILEEAGGWAVHSVSFKPWPACRHAHAAIDAGLALRDRGLDLARIDGIEIAAYADAVTFCDRARPTTTLEAKFSLQHVVASALIDGPPNLETFEAVAREREDIVRLRTCTTVREDAGLTQAYPSRYGTQVTVRTPDGEISELRADALGDPEMPMTAEAHVRKSHLLFGAASLTPEVADRARAACIALPDAPDLKDLIDALPSRKVLS